MSIGVRTRSLNVLGATSSASTSTSPAFSEASGAGELLLRAGAAGATVFFVFGTSPDAPSLVIFLFFTTDDIVVFNVQKVPSNGPAKKVVAPEKIFISLSQSLR